MGYEKLGSIDNNKYKIKGTPVFKENNDSKEKVAKKQHIHRIIRIENMVNCFMS